MIKLGKRDVGKTIHVRLSTKADKSYYKARGVNPKSCGSIVVVPNMIDAVVVQDIIRTTWEGYKRKESIYSYKFEITRISKREYIYRKMLYSREYRNE